MQTGYTHSKTVFYPAFPCLSFYYCDRQLLDIIPSTLGHYLVPLVCSIEEDLVMRGIDTTHISTKLEIPSINKSQQSGEQPAAALPSAAADTAKKSKINPNK